MYVDKAPEAPELLMNLSLPVCTGSHLYHVTVAVKQYFVICGSICGNFYLIYGKILNTEVARVIISSRIVSGQSQEIQFHVNNAAGPPIPRRIEMDELLRQV